MQELYHVTQLSLFDPVPQLVETSKKKQCRACKKWHDFDFFDSPTKQNTCKQCRRDRINAQNKDPEVRQKRRDYARNRYQSDASLRERIIETSHNTYNRNKEDILKKQRDKRREDPDKINAKKKADRNKNIEQYRMTEALYRYANKEIVYNRISTYRKTEVGSRKKKENNRRRNALKRKLPGEFTMAQFYARCEYYGWCCYLCEINLTEHTACIEHRIPITRDGTNWPANLAPACRSCNSRKRDRTEKEYKAWLSSLSISALQELGITRKGRKLS
jgi:5-methylcytosine-specific restriction endonuclease McrA